MNNEHWATIFISQNEWIKKIEHGFDIFMFIMEVRDDVYLSKAHLWNGRYRARRSCMWWHYKGTQCVALRQTSFLIFLLLLCFDHFQFAIACLRFFEQVLHSRCPNWFSVTFITQIVPCSIFSTPISTYFIFDLIFSLIHHDVQIQKKWLSNLKRLHSIFAQLLPRYPTSRTLTSQVSLLSLIFASNIRYHLLFEQSQTQPSS